MSEYMSSGPTADVITRTLLMECGFDVDACSDSTLGPLIGYIREQHSEIARLRQVVESFTSENTQSNTQQMQAGINVLRDETMLAALKQAYEHIDAMHKRYHS